MNQGRFLKKGFSVVLAGALFFSMLAPVVSSKVDADGDDYDREVVSSSMVERLEKEEPEVTQSRPVVPEGDEIEGEESSSEVTSSDGASSGTASSEASSSGVSSSEESSSEVSSSSGGSSGTASSEGSSSGMSSSEGASSEGSSSEGSSSEGSSSETSSSEVSSSDVSSSEVSSSEVSSSEDLPLEELDRSAVIEYTVKFYEKDKLKLIDTVLVKEGTAIQSFPTPADINNLEFSNVWVDGKGRQYGPSNKTLVDSDIDLVPVYNDVTKHTVRFLVDGSERHKVEVIHGKSMGVNFPADPSDKPSAKFIGWGTGIADKEEYASVTGQYYSYTVVNANEDLEAYWRRDIEFENAGTRRVADGSTLGSVPTASKTENKGNISYQYPQDMFEGWFEEGTSTKIEIGYTPTKQTTKAVAKWKELSSVNTYTVTFQFSKVAGAGADVVISGVPKGATIFDLPELSVPGVELLGWYNGNDKWTASTAVTGNVTLVPKTDTTKYQVTIKSHDTTKTVTVPHGQTVASIEEIPDPKPYTKTYTVYLDDGTTEERTAEYKFVGWRLGTESWSITNNVVTRAITLDAAYAGESGGGGSGPSDPNQYVTVKFYSYEGSNPPEKTVTIVKDQSVFGFTPKDRVGFTFRHWYVKNDSSKKEVEFPVKAGNDIDYIGYWEQDIQVVFDSKGGDKIGVQTIQAGGKATRPSVTPAKEGYVFEGWSETAQGNSSANDLVKFDFENIAITTSKAPGARFYLYAWYRPSTTITYHYNLESETISYIRELSEGEPCVFYNHTPDSKVVPNGWVLEGWYTAPVGGVKMEVSQPIDLGENTNVYARWNKGGITICFDPNSDDVPVGSVHEAITKSFEVGYTGSIVPPGFYYEGDGQQKGILSNGWYRDNACTNGPVDFTNILNGVESGETITLYGKWEAIDENKKVKAIFNANGGTFPGSGEILEIQVKMGQTAPSSITYPIAPTGKAGVIFGRWFLDQECTEEASLDEPLFTDTTFYARWAYDVKFVDFYKNKTFSQCAMPGRTVPRPDDPIDDKLTFVGWKFGSSDKMLWNFWTNVVDKPMTLNAVWAAEVSFDAMGGQSGPKEVRVMRDAAKKTIKAVADPVREGYRFGGWYKDSACTEENRFYFDGESTPTQVTENLTLYAKWSGVFGLTVECDPEAGGIILSRLDKEYLPGAEVSIAVEAAKGYRFAGWTVKTGDLSLTPSQAENPELTITMPSSPLTLVAHFKKMQPFGLEIVGKGTVTPQPESEYAVGEKISLTAKPEEGYRFAYWELTKQLSQGETPKAELLYGTAFSYEMPDCPLTVKAVFVQLYQLTVTAGVGGTLQEDVSGSYAEGDVVTITALPDRDFRFDQWETEESFSEGTLQSAAVSFKMPGHDLSMKAVFTPIYRLTVICGENGTVEGTASGDYPEFEMIDITAKPNAGYRLSHWEYSGYIVKMSNEIRQQFFMPEGWVVLKAVFVPVSTSGGGGGGSGGGPSGLSTSGSTLGPRSAQGTAAPTVYNLTETRTAFSQTTMNRLMARNSTSDVVLKGENVTFTFPKGTMKAVPGQTIYDFGVSFPDPATEQEIVGLAGTADVVVVRYRYSGQLPARAEIKIRVGDALAGKTVYYYYFNSETKKLELQQSAVADQNGWITVYQEHCSSYVVTATNLYQEPVPQVTPIAASGSAPVTAGTTPGTANGTQKQSAANSGTDSKAAGTVKTDGLKAAETLDTVNTGTGKTDAPKTEEGKPDEAQSTDGIKASQTSMDVSAKEGVAKDTDALRSDAQTGVLPDAGQSPASLIALLGAGFGAAALWGFRKFQKTRRHL